jgi:hypothetical protein
MKKMIKLAAVVLLLAVVATSCKKYPEGPAFTLKSKKARVEGDWSIESVKVNNNDVTSFFLGIAPGYKLAMTKDGNYTVTTNSGEQDKGTWKFGDKKETIIQTSTKNKDSAGNYEVTTSTILKLEDDAMWLKSTSSGGDVTETHFKQ